MDLIVLVLITFIASTVAAVLYQSHSEPSPGARRVGDQWHVLFINRKSIPTIWLRVAPVLIGLVVGVATGIAYYFIGLYSYESMAIIPYIIPGSCWAFLLGAILSV